MPGYMHRCGTPDRAPDAVLPLVDLKYCCWREGWRKGRQPTACQTALVVVARVKLVSVPAGELRLAEFKKLLGSIISF
jgi:hypothetical protein